MKNELEKQNHEIEFFIYKRRDKYYGLHIVFDGDNKTLCKQIKRPCELQKHRTTFFRLMLKLPYERVTNKIHINYVIKDLLRVYLKSYLDSTIFNNLLICNLCINEFKKKVGNQIQNSIKKYYYNQTNVDIKPKTEDENIKRLKIAVCSVPQMNCWVLQIIEQTHRWSDFGDDHSIWFISKEGFQLISTDWPHIIENERILYVRGHVSKKEYDKKHLIVTDKKYLDKLRKAVREYNEYFSKKDVIEKNEDGLIIFD